MSNNKDKLLTVGELARRGGVTVRTLQYYDTKGLLVPSEYSDGGRRMYNRRDIIRLQQIIFLKSMGFSLEEIRDSILPTESTSELEQMFKEQKQMLIEQISHIQVTVNQMDKVIDEIKLGSEIGIDRLFVIMKSTQLGNPYSFLIRHISKNQMEYFSNCFASEEVAIEFNKNLQALSAELIELYQQNEKPEDVKGQKLASRWWNMMMSLTKGNTELIKNMSTIFINDDNWPANVKDLKEATMLFLRSAIITYMKDNNIKSSWQK